MITILRSIISIVANVVFYVVLRMELYTDSYYLPDGEMHSNRRSPIDTLYSADIPWMLYMQVFLMIVSIATSLLVLFGLRNRVVDVMQAVSILASAAAFVIILIIAGNVHLRY